MTASSNRRDENGSPRDGVHGDSAERGPDIGKDLLAYLIGLGLAIGLTIASFWAAGTHLIYGPGVAMALITLAVAQMGVHLVFFLRITTAPDNTNNVLALAFGVLIVCLIVFGSIWIMGHLNHSMMPMNKLMQMQR
jgi:cytochrome o ubiquinol oxidase operon protein cyoD